MSRCLACRPRLAEGRACPDPVHVGSQRAFRDLPLVHADAPAEACENIIFQVSLDQAAKQFKAKTGVSLNVTTAAAKWLSDNVEVGQNVGDLLLKRLEGYEYGINFLSKKQLQISQGLLKNPKDHLESLIKKSYQENPERY